MNINFKLISSLLAAYGYRYNAAFGFEFVTATNATDSPLVELRFMYRSDVKKGAERVTIDLATFDDKVIPPMERGQRK